MKMRKIVTGLLTLSITLCAGLPTFATETTDNILESVDENSTRDVTVTIQPIRTIYNVEVVWDSLDFTYNLGEWNPSDHAYNGGSWYKREANIVVKNHSNADVAVDANFTNNAKSVEDTDLKVKANMTLEKNNVVSEGEVVLESADKDEYLNKNLADSTNIKVALENKTPSLSPKNKIIDKVTVKFGTPN